MPIVRIRRQIALDITGRRCWRYAAAHGTWPRPCLWQPTHIAVTANAAGIKQKPISIAQKWNV